MNARTHSEIAAYFDAVESAIPHAEECLCGDLDEFGNWIALQVGMPRAMSDYFGAISVQELVLMALNPSATCEQVKEAMQELRARYLADHKAGVQRRAEEMV